MATREASQPFEDAPRTEISPQEIARIALLDTDRGLFEGLIEYKLSQQFSIQLVQFTTREPIEPVITYELLWAEAARYAAGDRQRYKAAVTITGRLFSLLHSTSTNLMTIHSQRLLRDYCVNLNTDDRPDFAFKAQSFSQLAADKHLLDALPNVGPKSQQFLAHYDSRLHGKV
jgi:hypothetical protein